jgi:hypothetical protein
MSLRRKRIRSETAPGHEAGQGDEHHVNRDVHRFVAPGVNNGRTYHDQNQPDRCQGDEDRGDMHCGRQDMMSS